MKFEDFQKYCSDYAARRGIKPLSSKDMKNLEGCFLDAKERGVDQNITPGLAYVMAEFYLCGRDSRETTNPA